MIFRAAGSSVIQRDGEIARALRLNICDSLDAEGESDRGDGVE